MTFFKAIAGAMIGVSVPSLSFSGVFTTSSGSSPVTSATRTITGTGTLLFENLAGDVLTPEYSKNGGAWTNIIDGGTLAMTSGDTLAVRCTLTVVGWVSTFNIKNNSGGALIEAVTLTRT